MTQPANTFDTYDAVGIREDLSDMIYNVDPDATPFYSKSSKTKAKAVSGFLSTSLNGLLSEK